MTDYASSDWPSLPPLSSLVNAVHCIEALELMRMLPSESVDCVVTSPPYDNLRTYNGYSFDFEPIARETYRVLKPGGVCVWVVGDETSNFSESLTSFEQAIYFRKVVGFNLLDTMIYMKENYAPAYPSLCRYANQFEYMFVFSKGKPKVFNPIQKPKKQSSLDRYKYGNMHFTNRDGSKKVKDVIAPGTQKNASNVWSYPVGFKNIGHPAVFPFDLAYDHIKSWTNEGDLVLDYFGGSGTSADAARELGRNYITGDVSADYCDLMRKRLAQPYTPLFPALAG